MSADMALGTDGVLRSKIIEMKRSGIEMTGFQKRLILGLCMKFRMYKRHSKRSKRNIPR